MSIISVASGESCWRGLDYYNDKKVHNLKKINDYEFISIVHGTNNYNIYLNVLHPRQSTCNCPLAKGKRIICKHIVATFFTAFTNEAKMFVEEQEKLQEEYLDYQAALYKKAKKYIKEMPKKDLVEELLFVLDYAPEWVYDNFIRRNNIE